MKKIILITGASSGIGKALAIQLASLGHKIIATGRNSAALDKLQSSYPENIKTVTADISTHSGLQEIISALPENLDGIHLVNNAGIATPCLIQDMNESEFNQHYLVNVKAPVLLTSMLLPHLKNGGRILNISTGLAHYALPGFSAYGITKAALYLFKEYCNAELGNQGITCGSAMPGIVDTPIQEHIRASDSSHINSIHLFHGFKQRGELLGSDTAARFLAWLLLEAKTDEFIKGDWDIYDTKHHHHWAKPGEFVPPGI